MTYVVNSTDKPATHHRLERMAQREASKRVNHGDSEVTIDKVTSLRYGPAYSFERVPLRIHSGVTR